LAGPSRAPTIHLPEGSAQIEGKQQLAASVLGSELKATPWLMICIWPALFCGVGSFSYACY
jgi:hypothetical protein